MEEMLDEQRIRHEVEAMGFANLFEEPWEPFVWEPREPSPEPEFSIEELVAESARLEKARLEAEAEEARRQAQAHAYGFKNLYTEYPRDYPRYQTYDNQGRYSEVPRSQNCNHGGRHQEHPDISGFNFENLFNEPARPFTNEEPPSWRNTNWKDASMPEEGVPRPATLEDVKKWGLDEKLSLKRWNPDEIPIVLLGSVFDGYTLGEWIAKWTRHRCGRNSEFTQQARELWGLLIKLMEKMYKAKQVKDEITTDESYEMVGDFYKSGTRLMKRLQSIITDCEPSMLLRKRRTGDLGERAGVEFVEIFFGEGAFLHRTDSLMKGLQTWNHRFDANCAVIMDNPRWY